MGNVIVSLLAIGIICTLFYYVYKLVQKEKREAGENGGNDNDNQDQDTITNN